MIDPFVPWLHAVVLAGTDIKEYHIRDNFKAQKEIKQLIVCFDFHLKGPTRVIFRVYLVYLR